jgi:hypothetical protein
VPLRLLKGDIVRQTCVEAKYVQMAELFWVRQFFRDGR